MCMKIGLVYKSVYLDSRTSAGSATSRQLSMPGGQLSPSRCVGREVPPAAADRSCERPSIYRLLIRLTMVSICLPGMWSRSRRLGLETVSRPIEGLVSVSSRACRQTSRSRLGLGS